MTPHPSGVTDVGDAPSTPAAQYLPDAASGVAPAVDDTGHTTFSAWEPVQTGGGAA